MKIETVYDIGQLVYVIVEYQNDWGAETRKLQIIEPTYIKGIDFHADKDGTHCVYLCEYGFFDVDAIFVRKEDAEEKLKEKNDETNDYRSI